MCPAVRNLNVLSLQSAWAWCTCAWRFMDTAITIPATLLFKAPLALFRLNPASQKRVSQLSPLVSNDMQTGCQPTSQILLMGVVEAGEILQLKRVRKSLKIYNSVNNFSLSTCNICKIYFTVLSKYICKWIRNGYHRMKSPFVAGNSVCNC